MRGYETMKQFLSGSVPMLLLLMAILSGCGTVQYVSHPRGMIVDHGTAEPIMKPLNAARINGMYCGSVYFGPVQPVRWNKKLAQASLDHSLDMAKSGFLGHKGSDGSSTETRLARTGYSWSAYGENVGQGYKTPDEAVTAWLKSEMHCRNIMNPDFREAGSASAKSKNLRTYWTLVLGAPPQ